MYNALKHKRPYGATAVGLKTSVVFPLDINENIERVFIVLRDKENTKELRFPLEKTSPEYIEEYEEFAPYIHNSEQLFYGSFEMQEWGIWYYRFEGQIKDGGLAFYGRSENGDAVRGDWLPEWQLTVSKRYYKTPDWAKQGIIYHAFADRFAREGDVIFTKNGTLHDDWHELPFVERPGRDYKANDFFGGNIKGIISKLDYLESLGVTCLYLSPIFESRSNHRYDTGDYLKIDSLFGTEEEFQELIFKAKEKGISIMLDGVFNHTGDDSLYFNKYGTYPSLGAYQSKDSPYYSWYSFYDFPSKYHCWWGSTVVPTVNKNAQGYRDLLFGENGVIEKWTKMGVRGWRLDVVDELPIDFTTELCRKIKSVNSEALIVGEVWEDASIKVSYSEWRPYFMGEQLDSVMNYPFKTAILNYVLKGGDVAFRDQITKILEHYPKETIDVLMNLIDSHDTVRALTYLSLVPTPTTKEARATYRLNKDDKQRAIKRLKFVASLQFTLPGVPSLYYGDEAGVEGYEDPINRATYPWGRENKELLSFYTALGKMRKDYKDEFMGELVFIDEPILCYSRNSTKGQILVYANKTDSMFTKKLTGIDVLRDEEISTLEVLPQEVKIVFVPKR